MVPLEDPSFFSRQGQCSNSAPAGARSRLRARYRTRPMTNGESPFRKAGGRAAASHMIRTRRRTRTRKARCSQGIAAASGRRTARILHRPPSRTPRTIGERRRSAHRTLPSRRAPSGVPRAASRPPSPSAVLQGVETDRPGGRDTPVELALVVAGEVENVSITQLELAVDAADGVVVDQDLEVVRDRNEPADVGNEIDDATQDRPNLRTLACNRNFGVVGVADPPGRPQQRFAEDVLQRPDSLLAGEHLVARAARVEPLQRLDPEELVRFVLVRVEADVFANRELLLAYVRDRPSSRRLSGREGRHAVQVRYRPDQLVDGKAVVAEPVGA